jgi:hypothetical protein
MNNNRAQQGGAYKATIEHSKGHWQAPTKHSKGMSMNTNQTQQKGVIKHHIAQQGNNYQL